MFQTVTSFFVCLCTIKNFYSWNLFLVSLEMERVPFLPEARLLVMSLNEAAQFL